MTELIITPNYDKKTARFKGTIAGGESVKVTIVGAANWLSDGLRLRVVCGCTKTVAMFPLKSEDGTVSSFEVVGDDLIAAPLELNTIQARLYTQGFATTAATFIVEDLEKNILYFQDSYELHGWVKRDGDEEPYDLTKFPELIEDWRKQIENLIVDAKEVDGGIEVTICDGVSPAKTFIIRNGRDGQPGEPGRKGEDGKSLKFSDLTEAQKAELKGPKGDTGEGITDELKALPNKVTENAQAIGANRVAINTEENRAKGAEKELLTRIEDSKANAAAAMTAASKAQDTADKTVTEIATLVGDDAGDKRKSARQIAAEEVAKVVANAPADFDTLKEIAAYIESDKTGAAQMVTQIDANAKAISTEVSRAKGAEAALAGRVKELEENCGGSSVEVVAPNDSAVEGQAADANKTYEALEKKYDKPDTSTVALGTNALTGDAEGSGVGTIAIGENAKSQITGSIAIGQNAETTGSFPLASCLVAIGADAKATPNEPIVIGSDSTAITAKAKVVVTKDGVMTIGGKKVAMAENIPAAPDLTPYAKTAEVLPRYPFVDAAIVDGVVTIAPYTNAKIASDGTAFSVAVVGESGYMRDFVLVVDCTSLETAPKITWGTNFHPRTDAETDFACVAGVRNVYWITEYAVGEFVVAGWQETTGGNEQ